MIIDTNHSTDIWNWKKSIIKFRVIIDFYRNLCWSSISIRKEWSYQIAEKEQGMFGHSLGAISVLPDTF